jgi:FtsH-binding integral membrane protein
MALGSDRIVVSSNAQVQAEFDAGLRAHMLRVYNYMASGLALTGIVCYATMNSQDMLQAVFGLRWIFFIAALGMAFLVFPRIHKMSVGAGQACFWVFATIMGLWIAPIVAQYTGTSVARVFFITAGMFAGMSLYGYTTKKDLSGWASFLIMGMIGIFIGFLVNGFFIQSTGLHFAMSAIGVIVFTGLTAWDTQRIKNEYAEHYGEEMLTKMAILGALGLYMNFVNLFLMLLQFFGNRE